MALANNAAFDITYSKLLTDLKSVREEIIYEKTDNYKFSSKIIEIAKKKEMDLNSKVTLLFDLLHETRDQLLNKNMME